MSDTQTLMKPVPPVDADSRPYWEGANEGRFLYQRCLTCGKAQFYSRSLCSHCQSTDLQWQPAQGQGKVASYSVVYRAPIEAFAGDVPYVLALIDMDEGFRFMCNVLHCDPEAVRIDMRVRVIFEERPGSAQKIPQVEPI
jgi:uncharacterized OB-fold protein